METFSPLEKEIFKKKSHFILRKKPKKKSAIISLMGVLYHSFLLKTVKKFVQVPKCDS